ncbi:MAG: hypothetical protein RRA45_07555 [Saccharolobus sp.]|jgi:hypothetical protein|nr:hypothetical protein [Saccharolobus sp.]
MSDILSNGENLGVVIINNIANGIWNNFTLTDKINNNPKSNPYNTAFFSYFKGRYTLMQR